MQILDELLLKQLFHAVLHSFDHQWVQFILNIITQQMAYNSNRDIIFRNHMHNIMFLMIFQILKPYLGVLIFLFLINRTFLRGLFRLFTFLPEGLTHMPRESVEGVLLA